MSESRTSFACRSGFFASTRALIVILKQSFNGVVNWFRPRLLLAALALPVLALAIMLACNQALAASEKILWSFGAGTDGQFPQAGLIIDASGNLYSTTRYGGIYGTGTVFKLTPDGNESVLWSFGNSADGQHPSTGLITDTGGNLYGTTVTGGISSAGTVFKLTPNGSESVLWNFGNGTDGQFPEASLIMDASGNLYGTTSYGGIYGAGTVFKLTKDGNESVLWSFGKGPDGQNPSAELITDASGDLYGTTRHGGLYNNAGTVFKLTPPATLGGSWTELLLWNFGNGSDSYFPLAGLIEDASGNLYSTTEGGGAYGLGTVFKLTPPSTMGGDWSESILWSFGFNPFTEGFGPVAGLIMDIRGNLYGTTSTGGTYYDQVSDVGGTVFELTPPLASNGDWTEAVLWNFGNGIDGQSPLAGLIMDTSGNLYGTTEYGGISGGGTAFEIPNSNAPGGQIAVSSQRIGFPNTALGSTSSFQLGIRNTGKGRLIGTVSPPPAPFGISGSGNFNLAPNTQTFITLTFTPTSNTRFHRPDAVTSNSAQQSTINLDLRGTGIPGTVALNHSSSAGD